MNSDVTILKYTSIIYAVLFGVGIAMTLVFRKTNWGRNMFVATLSWLVLFLVFVGTSFASPLVFTLLIALIAALAVREYYVMNGVCKLPAIIIAVLLLGCLAGAIIAEKPEYYYSIPGAAALLFFAIQLFRSSPEGTNRDASLQYTGFMYWGWLLFHFTLLHRLEHGFGYIVLICSLIALNDNSAYFTGKLLGKNSPKLAPRISPGKTWAGTIGGSIATVCTAFVFWYAVPHLPFLKLAGVAVLVAAVIPVGDLIESAMKRDAGVKDSGKLIPGHGGVMDRFDSYTFTVPIMYYYILLVA
jgi:phosphatidate cytidylyltransferase